MGAHPLSFSEVLEDEYRYFHGEIQYGKVEFESKHVREIEDLDKRLGFHRTRETSSRWKVLAGAVATGEDRTKAIVDGFNKLLTDPKLLEKLMADEDFPDEVREPSVRRALLRVPIARRLLFENEKINAAIAGDPDPIDDFAALSAAIRVLKPHVAGILKAEPALLAFIADDVVAEKTMLDDPAAAVKYLRELFPPSPTWSIANLARQYTPFAGRSQKTGPNAAETAAEPLSSRLKKFREKLGITGDAPNEQIPDAELSRFNAILIEVAYSDYVCDGQGMRATYAAIHAKEPAALCLSGGGIRSATFNLGVLQGMADHRMLNRFHYISTVSGGGYIGSWLSSWIRRHTEGAVGVAKDLSRAPTDPLQPEVEPIRHLREYSSYLAPRATAFLSRQLDAHRHVRSQSPAQLDDAPASPGGGTGDPANAGGIRDLVACVRHDRALGVGIVGLGNPGRHRDWRRAAGQRTAGQ